MVGHVYTVATLGGLGNAGVACEGGIIVNCRSEKKQNVLQRQLKDQYIILCLRGDCEMQNEAVNEGYLRMEHLYFWCC